MVGIGVHSDHAKRRGGKEMSARMPATPYGQHRAALEPQALVNEPPLPAHHAPVVKLERRLVADAIENLF